MEALRADRPSVARGKPPLLTTAGGIQLHFRHPPPPADAEPNDPEGLQVHLDLARLRLLRGFDELLCLDGLRGVAHLPHQIETVRRVLRHFRGRVLLADEVGLGKTIEACMLLREFLMRGMARRVLILVPSPLVSQWQEELSEKFRLDFVVPPRTGAADTAEFWAENDHVLVSMAFAKTRKRAPLVSAAPWDLVIVDEAHHCKNRKTLNWQLVNGLPRRHLFLLTATPVQNNLVELYNLLTLLEPGHLQTEKEFKKKYVRRGNPRDPRNRHRLRSLLGEVMIRNTRSLVQMDLPPRYAQTIMAEPAGVEREVYRDLNHYLRLRRIPLSEPYQSEPDEELIRAENLDSGAPPAPPRPTSPDAPPDTILDAIPDAIQRHAARLAAMPALTRKHLSTLLLASGSHPRALARSLENMADPDDEAIHGIIAKARSVRRSAKDQALLSLLRHSEGTKVLIFATFLRTLAHLQEVLQSENFKFVTFSGKQSLAEKDAAVAAFRDEAPIMLCSESGGEGRNLQFANTLVNFDLPWNPMRIEQRVGRIHRIGQTREVFIFNFCTAGSLEQRILGLLNDKIRMFELVVGEVGSILGNLQGGDEFESLVIDLWMRSRDSRALDQSFDQLGDSLLSAQQQYLEAKDLDDALFGEDFD